MTENGEEYDVFDIKDNGFKNFDAFKHLNGVKVKNSKKGIFVVSLDEKNIDESLGSGFIYKGAETIYHEIKSHIDIGTGDAYQDHIEYGQELYLKRKKERKN